MTKKILVIAPHMDDEVLGVGATISRHVEQGDHVTVCVVANRAYGHKYIDSAISKEQEAARQAQAVLGYHDLQFLDLPDEQLDRGIIDIIVPLEKVCIEMKPDVVYTCHRGDINQDHQAVFKAATIVCRPISQYRPQRVLCYEVPSSTDQAPPFTELQFMPNLYVNLIPEYLERKVEAMRHYEKESRPFPHPRSPEGIIAYARKRGMEVGFEAAEAFMIVRDIWT